MSKTKDLEVADGRVVGIYYTLRSEKGEELDSTRRRGHKPLALLVGAGNVLPGLEKALLGRRKNEHLEIVLAPEEGYGPRQESLVEVLERAAIPLEGEILPGMLLTGTDNQGRRMQARVLQVAEGKVTIDRNHPLAGQSLRFEVTIVGVREASEEEKQHRHPHGPGGHPH